MSDALARIASLVHARSGITVGARQLPALRAAIDRVDGADMEQLLPASIGAENGVLDRLIDELTVNETYFMRQRAELDAIPWGRLYNSAREAGRQSVRVWSTACSSGEEAYSLAILALEALEGTHDPVSILATDISRIALGRAAAGCYGRRSLRQVEPALRQRYFEEMGPTSACVLPSAQRLVRLTRCNLVRDALPPAGEGSFDVIVCRNVLIYFDADTAERVAQRLRGALVGGGVLLFGAADRLTLLPATRASVPATSPWPRRRVRSRRPGHGAGSRARHGPRPIAGELSVPAPAPSSAGDQPRGEHGRIALALVAADAGQLDSALAVIGPLINENPLNAAAFCVRGLVLHAKGESALALVALRRAVYLDPALARAAFELGRVQTSLGDSQAAHRAFRQALETLENTAVDDHLFLGELDATGMASACRSNLLDRGEMSG
jgi:chemotaxis protein methyltransferase CheR